MRRFSVLALAALLAACANPQGEGPAAIPQADFDAAEAADAAAAIDQAAVPPPREAIAAIAATPPKPVRPRPAPRSEPVPPVPTDLSGQPMDEIIVTASPVTGLWRLTASHSIDIDIGLFSGVHIRYGGEWRDRNICWLQQSGSKVAANCVSGVSLKSGEGGVQGDTLTMRWWSGPATIIYAGQLIDAERIKGAFSGGVVGISVTGEVPAVLTRLEIPEIPPGPNPDRPTAQLLRQVWEEAHRGKFTEAIYESGVSARRAEQGIPRDIVTEPPQTLRFLGRILIRWKKEQRETVQDVYLVQSAAGRRLCRLAATESGKVIDASCTALSGQD